MLFWSTLAQAVSSSSSSQELKTRALQPWTSGRVTKSLSHGLDSVAHAALETTCSCGMYLVSGLHSTLGWTGNLPSDPVHESADMTRPPVAGFLFASQTCPMACPAFIGLSSCLIRLFLYPLCGCGSRSPFMPLSTFSMAISDMAVLVSNVPLPMCGNTMQLGKVRSSEF